MAPPPLKRLTALQLSRRQEIERMKERVRSRPLEELSKGSINSRIAALKDIWTEARQTHALIIMRDDIATDPYIVDNVFSSLQAAYEDLSDDLHSMLSHLDTNNEISDPGSVISDAGNRCADVIKLPKLDLPKFSGELEDWAGFADLFQNLVDSQRMNDATKLRYLKLSLTGTAATMVKDVATTNANYASTWRALKARFHNPRKIVSNHLDGIIELPALTKESGTDLRAFTDAAKRYVRALQNLAMPVEHWDVLLIHILSVKLDSESRKLWEAKLSAKDRAVIASVEFDNSSTTSSDYSPLKHFPTFTEFADFLEERAQTLSMVAPSTRGASAKAPGSKPTLGSKRVCHLQRGQKAPSSCPLCSGRHGIWRCAKFLAKTVYDRRAEVRRLKLCFNCLGAHRVEACTSEKLCRTCQEKHHSLLHFVPNHQRAIESAPPSDKASVHTSSIGTTKHAVLLATAQVTAYGPDGTSIPLRALIDQGSEASFVSESVAQLLGLPRRPANIALTGIGASSSGTARSITSFTLQSRIDPNFRIHAETLVLPRLTAHLPARSVLNLNLEQFRELTLADPQFNIRGSIDLIIGADLCGQLLKSGLRRFSETGLIAQNTSLGWVIFGTVQDNAQRRAAPPPSATLRTLHCASDSDLDKELQKFWTLEEIPNAGSQLTPEDEACENQFRNTHFRDATGRFVVQLPFKDKPPAVGAETRRIALSSLSHAHRRFARDPQLAQDYRDFMHTYEHLGHMTRVPASETMSPTAWYLPHHPVVQVSQLGRKTRVVFDASRRTQDRYCLNEFLMTGPALQTDLSLVLLNWRRYRFVFTADIVKMFRQIRVTREDQDRQRIVWAPEPTQAPIEYRLATVTYGTACAPYLAIRTLKQLAEDGRGRYPLGARCLDGNTYVDDIFAGADELSVAITKRSELSELLKSAGIELDKWAANHVELLPDRLRQLEEGKAKEIDEDASVKTLGVQWNPSQDKFIFTAESPHTIANASTKRAILSNIARLFDPLGWLAPVTVTAKILMQDLWIAKCEWDSPLPTDLRARWSEYCNSLSSLSDLMVERWLGVTTDQSYQLHGFADASTRAYAAAVYLRVEDGQGNTRVSLLAAKSKVAPVKTVSIPNLELCGAVLLVKLIRQIQNLDFLKDLPIRAWSDSQVVLMWLRKHPRSWKTFVANRVSLIQTELPSATWAHVPTKENPADLATRGAKPSDLATTNLWWSGPTWLSSSPEKWPQMMVAEAQVSHAQIAPIEPELLSRFSSLSRLTRVIAYCLRPLLILRRRRQGLGRLPSFLTATELSAARTVLVKLAQTSAFSEEIALIRNGRALPKRHTLCKLSPFVDAEGVLRVGGRLAHSDLPRDQKNPAILPYRSALSRLFARHAHITCLHGGPTLTANFLVQRAYILGQRKLVKTVIRNCITCQRNKPHLAHQLMGDLPAARVTPARPFSIAGLDYAGPIQVRVSKGRGNRAYKGYIALFVCFATRAIHLELVSDLTTASFIAAYRRFVGRRGVCNKLYSDNATTFRGADRELKDMFTGASCFYSSTASLLANDGTDWSFIPPNAPHYGGLWEAGVKSTKHHLKRVIGEHTLTFEELSTLLVEIEVCLNSRPLSPLTSDPEDLQALTPAHFLIGHAPALIPDEDVPSVPENRLNRFQLLQRMKNNFWKRWSNEYLQTLQARNKWRDLEENFAIGQLVLVRDDRYPPAKWPLGRVIEVHPGPDGLVRVATIKTATTTLRRHIARLCPLSTPETNS